jgi:hypothetical protein
MKTDQVQDEPFVESAGAEEAVNAEPGSASERDERERAQQVGRSRAAEADLILHDDDEAELDLPR